MKRLKDIMLEIDMLEADPFPAPAPASQPDDQQQMVDPATQFLPEFPTQHDLDKHMEEKLSEMNINAGDWNSPGSDTYQKYQAFIQALWKEIEFKRGNE